LNHITHITALTTGSGLRFAQEEIIFEKMEALTGSRQCRALHLLRFPSKELGNQEKIQAYVWFSFSHLLSVSKEPECSKL
jgi:hypothetical protein